ncbi:MAG: negative modulator of initiation of replication [Alteromonadaceae bacterium]|jgi:negative modulator of initiation of replication
MKVIEVDDELYQFIASKTEQIGEQASDILRRLLGFEPLVLNEKVPAEKSPTATVNVAVNEAQLVDAASQEAVDEKSDSAADKVAAAPGMEVPINNPVKALKKPTTEKKPTAIKAKANPKAAAKIADEPTEPKKPIFPTAKLKALGLNKLAEQKGVVGRFLYILATLQKVHAKQFDNITGIRGRDRLYFAKGQEELSESGSSINPKEIGHSGYWVLTNSNTSRKKWMLGEVARMLGYGANDLALLGDMLEDEEEARAKKLRKEQTRKAKLAKEQKKNKQKVEKDPTEKTSQDSTDTSLTLAGKDA